MSKNISDELAEKLAIHIYQYPTLFKTGGDVLNHMFCCYGTGYEWNEEGELEEMEYPYVDENINFETFLADRFKHLPPINEKDRLREIKRYADEYSRIVLIRATCNERAKDKRVTYRQISNMSKYSPINNIPINVKPVWQEAIDIVKEMIEWYPNHFEYEEWKKIEPMLVYYH